MSHSLLRFFTRYTASAIAWLPMMRHRHSLRFRILTGFVASGLLPGPLLVFVLLMLAYELEESADAGVISERLHRIMAKPADFPLVSFAGPSSLKVMGSLDGSEIPAGLAEVAPGLYELESGKRLEHEGGLSPAAADAAAGTPTGRSWYLAIGRRDGTTYVVADDHTALEYRESLTGWLLAAGTLLALYLSLWFGYLISRRLIQPVQRLAGAVSVDTPDGDIPPIEVDDYPDDEVGELAAAIERYRCRLRQALERERSFSSDASHELRNPLAVIQSSLEIGVRDSGVAPTTHRALVRAHEAALEMSDTVNALLLLVRVSPDRSPHDAIDVAAVVTTVVERYRAQTEVVIHWVSTVPSWLRVPEVAIRTTAENLIRNAVQHTRAGRIEVELTGSFLTVRDTGVGIPERELADIRDPGVRGSNSVSSGTGLGLSLVDRLCRRFAWRLTITSIEGEGTTAVWHFR